MNYDNIKNFIRKKVIIPTTGLFAILTAGNTLAATQPEEITIDEDVPVSATVASQPVQAPVQTPVEPTLTTTGKPVASKPLIVSYFVNSQVKADYGTANQSSKAPNGSGILESDLTGSSLGVDARINPTIRFRKNQFASLPVEFRTANVSQDISLEGLGKVGTISGPENNLFVGAQYKKLFAGKDLDSLVGAGLGLATFSRNQEIEYLGAKTEQATSSSGVAPVLSYALSAKGKKILEAMFRRASTSGTDKVNTTIPVLGALPEVDSKYSRTANLLRTNVYLPEIFSLRPSFESELEWLTEKYTDNSTGVVDTLSEANLGLEFQVAYPLSHGFTPVAYLGTRNMLSGDSSVTPGSENSKSHLYGGVMVKYDFSHSMLKPTAHSATQYQAPAQMQPVAPSATLTQAPQASATIPAQSKPLPKKKVVAKKPAVKQKKPSKK